MLSQLLKILTASCLVYFSAPSMATEASDQHAALMEGNEQTKALLAEQNYADALLSAEATYNLSKSSFGEDDPTTSLLSLTYARLLNAMGSHHAAHKLFKKATEILEEHYGPNDINLAAALIGKAERLKRDEKIKTVKRALNILRDNSPDEVLLVADAAREAGQYLAVDDKTRDFAQDILKESLTIYEKKFGSDSAELIDPLMLLGVAHSKHGKSGTPASFYNRALNITEKHFGEREYISLQRQAGMSLLEHTSTKTSRRYLKAAYDSSLKSFGDQDPLTGWTAFSLAQYQLARNNPKKAEKLLTQALDVFDKHSDYRNQQRLALALMIEILEERGQREEATQYCHALGKISPWTDTQDYRPIYKVPPKYPKMAATSGVGGHVIVEFTVDENGFVTQPQVIEAEGPKSFRTASLEAVQNFRYAPAFVDGQAVATEGVRNKFVYTLSTEVADRLGAIIKAP